MLANDPWTFWRDALGGRGSALRRVTPSVLLFGAFALLVTWLDYDQHFFPSVKLGTSVSPYEVAGAVLSLLLVVRTNFGYERWWEARRAWGGIVNSSRNLAISALAYGPTDPVWRERVVHWTAAFGHATRASLRGQRVVPEIEGLLGPEDAARVTAAEHMPGFVNLQVARLLRLAYDQGGLDRFGFLEIDRERAALIDQIGVCERILKTPPPSILVIMTRRFILVFLLTLPFPLILKSGWLTPLITMLVAFPVLSLDQASVELQNPFSKDHKSHLPLDAITATIEGNLLALLDDEPSGGAGGDGALLRAGPSGQPLERP